MNEITKKERNENLISAAFKGDTKLVLKLLEEGVDINYERPYMAPALISCIDNKQYHLIDILINAGSDIHQRDYTGRTVIYSLCYNGSKTNNLQDDKENELLKYFINLGVDINLGTCHGRIPLDWAIFSENLNNIRLLINSGADASEYLKDEFLGKLNWKQKKLSKYIRKCIRENLRNRLTELAIGLYALDLPVLVVETIFLMNVKAWEIETVPESDYFWRIAKRVKHFLN